MDETHWTAEPVAAAPIARQSQQRTLLPILPFAATCLSTWLSGGFAFSPALMTTL